MMESNLVYFGLVECQYQEIKFKDNKLVILLSKVESVECVRTLCLSYINLKSVEFASDHNAFTVLLDKKDTDKSLRYLIGIDPSVTPPTTILPTFENFNQNQLSN